MIERYARPAMGRLWSEDAKYGRIPAEAMERIRKHARVWYAAQIGAVFRRVGLEP